MSPFRQSDSLSGKKKYYRPIATRTETLVVLFSITLLLIALLEYSCHVIPQHSGFGAGVKKLANVTISKLDGRDDTSNQGRVARDGFSSIEGITQSYAGGSTYLITRNSSVESTTNSVTSSLVAVGSSYLTQNITTFILLSAGATCLTPGTASSVRKVSMVGTLTPATVTAATKTDATHLTPGTKTQSLPTVEFSTSAHGLVISNPPTTKLSPILVSITSDYVSTITISNPTTTNKRPSPNEPETTTFKSNQQVPDPPTTKPSPVLVSITSDYVSAIIIFDPTTTNKRPSFNEPETTASKSNQQVLDSTSIQVVTFTSSSLNPDRTFAEVITITSSSLVHLVPSSIESQNEPVTSSPASVTTAKNTADSSMLVVLSTFKSVYESTIFPTSSNTIVSSPIATSANSSGTFIYHSDGTVTAPLQITWRQYLTTSFLPLFLVIFYAIPWRILDSIVRHMEPFYQLRPFSPSTESEAIRLDYESTSTFLIPFIAITWRHFTVFFSSLISIIMLAVAPIASQVMVVVESKYCEGSENDGRSTCDSWGIYPNFARLVEGLLGAIALSVLFLIFAGLRRNTGVYSEPLSLVGLATMYRKAPFSVQGMKDSQWSRKEDKSRTAAQSYASPSTSETDMAGTVHNSALLRSKRRQDLKKTFVSRLWDGIKIRLIHICGLCLLGGILGVVAAYYEANADTGFNRFMNSQGFGVRFLMTALGTGTNLLWSRIDEDLRTIDPYYQLLRFNTKPQNSILAPVHMSPYSALIPSLRRKHYLISFISFCSILSEILPITLANIPYSATETHLVLLVCFYLAMGILSLMIIGVIILLFRPRHYVNSLPKRPCTIAARLEYLAPAGEEDDSNLLRSVDGLALLEREERDARIIARGKLYSMGIGEDGRLRIDEDERIVREWGKESRNGGGV